MSRSLFLCLMTLLACGCKAEDPRRHFEKEGGFSFVPPEGWEMKSGDSLKYKLATGPVSQGVPVNLQVVDRPFPGTVDDFVRSIVRPLSMTLPDANIVKRETFQAYKDLHGIKMVIEVGEVRQSCYFFGKGPNKFMVTGTSPTREAARFEPIFDATLKTFRFDP